LCFNPNKIGYLASAGHDHKVCVWDIESAKAVNSTIAPLIEINHHKGKLLIQNFIFLIKI